MADSGAIRAGRAFVEIFSDDSALRRGLAKSQAFFNAWGKAMTAAGLKMVASAAGLAAPILAAGKVFADMGDQLAKASVRTGVAVETLSRLKYAAEQSGLSFEDMEGALRKMQKTLFDARTGSAESAEALGRLHVSLKELKNLSPDQQFKLIADRLSKVEDPTKRAGLAMKIFGKSATSLLPLLHDGAGGIDELMKQCDALGLTMSTADAKAAEEFGDRMADLWQVVKAGVFTVGGALAPAIRQIVTHLTAGIVAVRAFVAEHRALITVVGAAALGIAGAMAAGGAAMLAFGAAGKLVGFSLGGVNVVLGGVGSAAKGLSLALGLLASPLKLAAGAAVQLGLSLGSSLLLPVRAIGLAGPAIAGLLSPLRLVAGGFSAAGAAAVRFGLALAGSSVRPFAAALGNALLSPLRAAVPLFSGLAGVVAGPLGAAGRILGTVFGVAAAALGAFGGVVGAVLGAILSPVGLAVAAVLGLGAVLAMVFTTNGQKLGKSLLASLSDLPGKIASVAGSIGSAVGSALTSAVSVAGSAGGLFQTIFGQVDAGPLKSAASAVGGVFRDVAAVAAGAMGSVRGAMASAAGFAVQAFSTVRGYLSGVWRGLKADSLEAFGGIKAALASGDWGTAAKILWTYLKLEWAKGSAVVRGLWVSFKAELLDVWGGLVAGVEKVWSYMKEYLTSWDGVKTAALKFAAWFKSMWENTIDFVADKLAEPMVRRQAEKDVKDQYAGRTLTKNDADKLADSASQPKVNALRNQVEAQIHAERPDLKGQEFADELEKRYEPQRQQVVQANRAQFEAKYAGKQLSDADVQELIDQRVKEGMENLRQQRAARDQQKTTDYDARQKALDDQFKAGHPDLVNEQEAARAKIDAEREAQRARIQAELAKAQEDGSKAGQEEIAALQQQLAEAGAAAGGDSNRAALDAIAKRRTYLPAPDFDHRQAKENTDDMMKSFASGTFNASVLFGLDGGGSDVEKNTKDTAQHTKATAETIKMLAQAFRQNPKAGFTFRA